MKFTKQDVVDALNIFEKLEVGGGKVAGATVARAVVSTYLKEQLEVSRPERIFTAHEISLMRQGKKLYAVKAVRDRLGISLMEAKRYVEGNGGAELHKSGKFDAEGQPAPNPSYY